MTILDILGYTLYSGGTSIPTVTIQGHKCQMENHLVKKHEAWKPSPVRSRKPTEVIPSCTLLKDQVIPPVWDVISTLDFARKNDPFGDNQLSGLSRYRLNKSGQDQGSGPNSKWPIKRGLNVKSERSLGVFLFLSSEFPPFFCTSERLCLTVNRQMIGWDGWPRKFNSIYPNYDFENSGVLNSSSFSRKIHHPWRPESLPQYHRVGIS